MKANACGSWNACPKPESASETIPIPDTTSAPQETIVKEEVVEPTIQPEPTPAVVNSETVPEVTPTPVVEEKKEVTLFESKLQQLEEMGFESRALNIELLVKYKGDMIATVRNLLQF